MDSTCVVIELKIGTNDQVAEWAEYINQHKAQALDTLKSEGVTLENFFRVTLEGKEYLIGYMRALDMSKAQEAVKKSISPVDARHQAFKKATWNKVVKAELLVELSRIRDEATYTAE